MPDTGNLLPGDERDRGVLTPDDRRYLRGEKEYANVQSERDVRYRIRKRIHNAILDFSILFHHLQERDRQQVFKRYLPPDQDKIESGITREDFQNLVEGSMFANSVSSTIAFLYLGITDLDQSFEPVLTQAIKDAEEERGYLVRKISTSIDIGRREPDVKELASRFTQGEPLSKDELEILIRSDEFGIDSQDLDHIFERLAEQLTEEGDESSIGNDFDTE